MGQRLIINESERNNIRGLYENHGSTKIEHHLNNMVDQMSDEQVQQLQQELDTMGITAHTGVKQAMSIVKQEESIQSDMDEAMKKQKAAEILSDIGSGLMASTLVPLIPLAIGHAMNIGFSGGLAVHFATAGLLLSLADVIRKKQGSTENRNS
jgi:hypothetical protein